MRASQQVLVSLCIPLLSVAYACSEAGAPDHTPTAPQTTPTSAVVALVVFPAQVALHPGDDTALAVTAVDSTGQEIAAPSLTWTTSDTTVATVSAIGMVKAIAAGSATITAIGDGKAGTSSLSVAQLSDSTPPVDSQPPVDSTPPVDSQPPVDSEPPVDSQPPVLGKAECGSYKAGWIWCDDFEQDRLSSYFEYQAAGSSFVRATGVGVDSSYGMRAHFAQGQTSAGALHLAFGKTPQSYFRPVDDGTAIYRDVYWRMYVRNQAGWTGGGGDKLSRAISFASSSTWAEAMMAHVWSSTAQPDHLTIDPASGTDESGVLKTTTYNDFANLRWLGAITAADPMFDAANVGTWHCVEAHATLNDAGQSNGVFELWVDGTLEAQHTGLNWVGSFSGYGINAVFFENFWNAGSPVAQDRYFDNIVVSTEKIGCLEKE